MSIGLSEAKAIVAAAQAKAMEVGKPVTVVVVDSGGFSVIGGGDTIAAVQAAGVTGRIGYISTAGGAFLEFLEGRVLPGVAALTDAPPGEAA